MTTMSSCLDQLAADLDVLAWRRRAMWVTGLVYRNISSTAMGSNDGIRAELGELIGMVDECQRAEGDQVAGGLVAGDQQQEREVEQVGIGEPFAVDLRRGQDAEKVVRRWPRRSGAPRSAW